MKYCFPLTGFELRTFNDAVEKNEKNYREGREKNPEIYREGRENISWKFPRQVDCGLARALLDTEISREFICSAYVSVQTK